MGLLLSRHRMVHEGKRRQKKSRTRYSAYGRRRSLDVGRVLVSCVTAIRTHIAGRVM